MMNRMLGRSAALLDTQLIINSDSARKTCWVVIILIHRRVILKQALHLGGVHRVPRLLLAQGMSKAPLHSLGWREPLRDNRGQPRLGAANVRCEPPCRCEGRLEAYQPRERTSHAVSAAYPQASVNLSAVPSIPSTVAMRLALYEQSSRRSYAEPE